MAKEFKDIDLVGDTAMACEDLSEFNAVSPEEQIAVWSSSKDYDYKERMENLRRKYPMLFDGSMSVFGPRTEEERIARFKKMDQNAVEAIASGVHHSLDDLFNEMEEDFPWLFE